MKMRKRRIILKHQANVAAVQRLLFDRAAMSRMLPSVGVSKPAMQRRSWSCAAARPTARQVAGRDAERQRAYRLLPYSVLRDCELRARGGVRFLCGWRQRRLRWPRTVVHGATKPLCLSGPGATPPREAHQQCMPCQGCSVATAHARKHRSLRASLHGQWMPTEDTQKAIDQPSWARHMSLPAVLPGEAGFRILDAGGNASTQAWPPASRSASCSRNSELQAWRQS
jgi:hypothetical protein